MSSLEGPLIYADVPFNVDYSERWFIQLWNHTIVPHLNDILATTVGHLKDSFDQR
jgi:hypothetical protein